MKFHNDVWRSQSASDARDITKLMTPMYTSYLRNENVLLIPLCLLICARIHLGDVC